MSENIAKINVLAMAVFNENKDSLCISKAYPFKQ